MYLANVHLNAKDPFDCDSDLISWIEFFSLRRRVSSSQSVCLRPCYDIMVLGVLEENVPVRRMVPWE